MEPVFTDLPNETEPQLFIRVEADTMMFGERLSEFWFDYAAEEEDRLLREWGQDWDIEDMSLIRTLTIGA